MVYIDIRRRLKPSLQCIVRSYTVFDMRDVSCCSVVASSPLHRNLTTREFILKLHMHRQLELTISRHVREL